MYKVHLLPANRVSSAAGPIWSLAPGRRVDALGGSVPVEAEFGVA